MPAHTTQAINVRMTTALRAPTHSLAWCGMQTGVFARQGLAVNFPVIETTGPVAVAGLARGALGFLPNRHAAGGGKRSARR